MRPFVLLAAAAAILPGWACSRPDGRPNVVVIVLDTARPDYLSAYGHPRPTTPFLERFVASGTRFDRAYSTSCWTLPAHASLFTGEPPEVHGATQAHVRVHADLPLVAERLRDAGYQTACFSNNVWISAVTGLEGGFERFYDRTRLVQQKLEPDGQHWTVADVRRWIAQERDATKPAFVFVNLIEPHMPYYPPEEAARHFLTSREEWARGTTALFPLDKANFPTIRHYGRKNGLDEHEWRVLRGLYEGDLRMVDEVARRIVADLDAVLPRENTLVFVLSDHGENLGDHDHLEHHFNLYDSNLRIALIARGPGFRAGAVEARLAQISDLYPTLLNAAGLDDSSLSTFDLRGALPDRRVIHASLDYPRVILSAFPPAMAAPGSVLEPYKRALGAAIGPRFKMIRGSDGAVEVYDLVADPAELHPLSAETLDAQTRDELEAHVALALRGIATTPGAAAPLPTDAAALEALRALGYTR